MVIVTLLLTSTKVSQVTRRLLSNKEKVTQTIENDERTAKTHKNPSGNLGPKSQRKTSTHDDNKENQSTKFKPFTINSTRQLTVNGAGFGNFSNIRLNR